MPLIGDTIGVHLDRMAALSPDRPALIGRHQDIRWTYGEFRERVDALAPGFLASASGRGIASASGRRTAWNGC